MHLNSYTVFVNICNIETPLRIDGDYYGIRDFGEDKTCAILSDHTFHERP